MRDPDQQIFEEEIGLVVGESGRTLIEEDARDVGPMYSLWELDYRACCLAKWHDIRQTVRVRDVDDEATVFGHRWRLSAWQKARLKDKFWFPGVCPEHGNVRLAPRGVVAHLPREVPNG